MTNYEEKVLVENMDTIKLIVRCVSNSLGISNKDYEDYLQEAYLVIYKKADKYDEKKGFYNFAYSVIKNRFIDLYRQDTEKRIEKISMSEIILSEEGSENIELSDILKTDANTENEALKNITIDMIKKYIANKKKSCTAKTIVKGFEALELKIAGYSGEEIADLFNVPSNSVRCWMSKAKKNLRADNDFMELIAGV